MNLPNIYLSKLPQKVYKYYLRGAFGGEDIKIQGVLKNNSDDLSFENIFLLYKNIYDGIDLKSRNHI